MSPEFHALLIGVNAYLPNHLPGGGSYRPLRGCVRDVEQVAAYLRSALGVPAGHIARLTATAGPDGQPLEPPAQLPTYQNMVAALQALAAAVSAGDQVLVHYSGHGGRTPTAFPELKGADGLDEALVPYDIGDPEARYLRDVELSALLKDIASTGAFLTVVLDSCHAGGATRGQAAGVSTAVARGMDPGETIRHGKPYDPTVRPAGMLAAPRAALVASWGAVVPGPGAPAAGSGWLQSTQGYTLLAACRANESAYEDVFEVGERSGALTYWLLRSLPTLPPRASYRVLHNLLLARIRSWMGRQTPQLQGDPDRLVFGTGEAAGAAFGFLVAGVDLPAKKVSLNAGEAHGLRPGMLLAVYPNGAADLTSPEGRQAILRMTELVGDVDSRALIAADLGHGPLQPGAQAVVAGAADPRLQRTVALAAGVGAGLQAALAVETSGFLRVAAAGEAADFQVGIVGGGYEIWDRSGTPVPNLRPPIESGAAGAAERVVQRLVHLAKYENVRAIENTDPVMSKRVRVDLHGAADVYLPGQHVTLEITNLLAPNPFDINDAARILNVTVLQLAYDYSIKQCYPPPAEGPFVILQPGASLALPFEAELPAPYDEVTDILKVFVTQKTTDFRSLRLPSLDTPRIPVARKFDEMHDPLDRFLASFAGDQAPAEEELQTRSARIAAAHQRPWATSQVEITVRKP